MPVAAVYQPLSLIRRQHIGDPLQDKVVHPHPLLGCKDLERFQVGRIEAQRRCDPGIRGRVSRRCG